MLRHLQNDIYCRIGVSKIPEAGVGVICIKTIPKGVNPFKTLMSREKVILVDERETLLLPKNVQKIVDDFYVSDDQKYGMNQGGPNAMPLSFYINHSKKPNMKLYDTAASDWTEFKSNRIIHPGEELTIDYDDYK